MSMPTIEGSQGFPFGRWMTGAYVAAQVLLGILACVAGVGVGLMLMVLGMIGQIASATGVFDRSAAEQEAVLRDLIKGTGQLWPQIGTTAASVVGVMGLFIGIGLLRYLLRAQAPRGDVLNEPRILDPLPEGLRGRKVHHTSPRTVIERDAVCLDKRTVMQALTGRGYRFTVWHEWYHAETGDTIWAFVGGLFGRAAAFVVALWISVLLTFTTPLNWAPGILAPVLVVMFSVGVFILAYRWSTSTHHAFTQIKEFLADAFASSRSGESADLVYAANHGAGASGYLTRAGKEPTAAERLRFLEFRRSDRFFVLCSGLMANWLLLRLMCTAMIGPVGIGGLLVVAAIDVAMLVPLGILLWAAARHGSRPRSVVGWGMVLAPVLVVGGLIVPFLLFIILELGPWLDANYQYYPHLVVLVMPWIELVLLIVLGAFLARRAAGAAPRPVAGRSPGSVPPRGRWAVGLADGISRLTDIAGRIQSWTILLIAGVPLGYAIVVSLIGLRLPDRSDAVCLLLPLLTFVATIVNLMQCTYSPTERRVWPLAAEACGGTLMVTLIVYIVVAFEHLQATEFRGTVEFQALALRMNDYLVHPDPVLLLSLAGSTLAQVLPVVLTPYAFRLWALRRPAGTGARR